MRTRRLALGIVFAGLMAVAIAGPAFAHHAWTGYDMSNLTTFKGTVVKVDFVNPHVWMSFDVKDDRGNVQHWSGGGPSLSKMMSNGWSKDIVKEGDQITAIGNKITNGELKMRLYQVVLANRKSLDWYKNFRPGQP
jgi:hypothetical protein